MKCVIIGTGWLGNSLAAQLSANGLTVYGSRRSAEKLSPESSFHTFVYPSVDAASIIQEADVLVLAFPPDRSTVDHYAEDCLQVCQHSSANCHIILTSSTSVYPDHLSVCREQDLQHTDFPEHPIILAEKALLNHYADRLTIVRLAGLIGPGRYPVKNMAASGKTYEGSTPVNVIHQTDAVGLIEFIIRNGISGEIINACSPEHPLRGTFYMQMAKTLDISPPIFTWEPKQGKLVDPRKSLQLGYVYTYSDPMCFPEVTENKHSE